MEQKKLNEEDMGVKEELPQISEGYIPSEYVYEDEDTDQEESNEGLLTGEKYDLPKSRDSFINTADGKVIDKENLSPFEIIKAVAKQTGTEIKKPNSSCKKCYGRGFMGKDVETSMPIPCTCIYPPKTDLQKMNEAMYDNKKINSPKLNRDQRRRLKKMMTKSFKKLVKQEMNKSNLQKDSVSADNVEEVISKIEE